MYCPICGSELTEVSRDAITRYFECPEHPDVNFYLIAYRESRVFVAEWRD